MTAKKDGQKRTPTRAERSIMAVLSNPECFNWTNEAIIEAAEVARSTFYKITADPWFIQYQRDTVLQIVRNSVGAITSAAIATAAMTGRDGHADRKMILQMGGLHADKSSQEVSGPGGGPIEYIDRQRAAAEELDAFEAAEAEAEAGTV